MIRYKLVSWDGETVATDLRDDQAYRRQAWLMFRGVFTDILPDDETKRVPVKVTGSDADFTMRIETE